MNRRLLLIAACAVLPCTTLGAQIVQPGGASADDRSQGKDAEERKARKKNALAGIGMGFGGGLMYAFRGDAESVTQQDWCIGACGPLRASARATQSDGPGLGRVAASSSSSGAGASHSGVLALLESLGNVSENAIDAITNAPGQQDRASDDMPGNSNAAEHRANAATRKAAKSTPVAAGQSDFDAAMNGCVLGCDPAPARVISPEAGDGEGLFVAAASTGPVLLEAGDVNTIVNPEPSTVILMLSGLAAMAAVARRKRNVD